MKRLVCIAAALLLAVTFALPASANPEETPDYAYEYENEYYDNDENPEETTAPPPTTTQPLPETVNIDEIIAGVVDEMQAAPIPPCPFDEASLIVTYAALGTSLLALLLAIIALAKIGKAKKENATGNYKKFF